MRLYEITVAVGGEKVGEPLDGLDGVVRLAEVEDIVPVPGESKEFTHTREKHRKEGGAAPYRSETISSEFYIGESGFEGQEFSK